MGSFATLFFAGYPVNDTKNYLDSWIFKESDKRVFKRKLLERDDITWEPSSDDDKIETAFVFEASVSTIIKRLEVLGHTLEACEHDFKKNIQNELKKLPEIEEYDAEFVVMYRALYSKYGKFEQWLDAFAVIVRDRPHPVYSFEESKKVHDNQLVDYMLNSSPIWSEDWHPCGFQYPTQNLNLFARAFLESCDKDAVVQLDATDLVEGGWYEGFVHLEEIVNPHTRFYDVFCNSLAEVMELADQGQALGNQTLLAKVLFANVITALEAYLSDTLVYTIISFPPLVRCLVESDPEFQRRKIELKDLFRRHDAIKSEVGEYLEGLMYHNLSKVRELYRTTLRVEFPREMGDIFRAVEDRHDIVHRNGRRRTGEIVELSMNAVKGIADAAKLFVEHIDHQVKNV